MSGITIILKVYIVNWSKEMERLKKSKCQLHFENFIRGYNITARQERVC